VNIPFKQNPGFVGQEQILTQLKAVLEDAQGGRQVALYGLGGIGCVALKNYVRPFTYYGQKVASCVTICI
jgi:hypothetical protein